MSTKIYTAYRFPKGRLAEFLGDFREQTIPQLKRVIDAYLEAINYNAFMKELLERHPDLYEFSQEGFVIAGIQWIAKVSERSALQCALNLWPYGKYFYAVPYFPMLEWQSLVSYNNPNWVQPYHYWDNTDRDETISRRAWNQRGKVWEKVCLEDWSRNRLLYTVLDGKDLADWVYDYLMEKT